MTRAKGSGQLGLRFSLIQTLLRSKNGPRIILPGTLLGGVATLGFGLLWNWLLGMW